MKTNYLFLTVLFYLASTFIFAGNPTSEKEKSTLVAIPEMNLAWNITTEGRNLKGATICIFLDGELVMVDRDSDGALTTKLLINKVYDVKVLMAGYVRRELKLVTFTNPKNLNANPSELTVDMISDRELLKPEHIEQIIHEEILMYDESKKKFVPCADYTEALKLRFYELMKRKTRCLTEPTQKIKS